jgi:hypothetical protein
MSLNKILNFPGTASDTSDIESLLESVSKTADLPCWDDELSKLIRDTVNSTLEENQLSDNELEMVKAAAYVRTEVDDNKKL